MKSVKVKFENPHGEKLAAKIEFPVNQHPHTFAIFAHCFTCNKNLTAVRNISRALNLEGIAVMRFDFTGLGESEGDFADTNFSSNVEDLVHAAEYITQTYQAPSLLIGHSLGGAAVIKAAALLPSIRAVATIGAPFDPSHVSHLLQSGLPEIEKTGIAEVAIGGRKFTVKQQFLEDIKEQNQRDVLQTFKKALLVMHSPQDRTVAIENAFHIYTAARHPKSFISLDGADHLLSNKEDSHYAGCMIANWATRYLELPSKESFQAKKSVALRLSGDDFTTDIMVRHHSLTADEPLSVGGNDFGPTPYELVSAGLGACTAMTLKMYARRKKWDLQEVRVHLAHSKVHAVDCENCENPKSKIDTFDKVIELEGDLTPEQKERLLEISERCPVHRTLHGSIQINSRLKD